MLDINKLNHGKAMLKIKNIYSFAVSHHNLFSSNQRRAWRSLNQLLFWPKKSFWVFSERLMRYTVDLVDFAQKIHQKIAEYFKSFAIAVRFWCFHGRDVKLFKYFNLIWLNAKGFFLEIKNFVVLMSANFDELPKSLFV